MSETPTISHPWAPPAGGEPPPLRGHGHRRAAAAPASVAAIVGATVVLLGIDGGGTGRGAWGLAALSFAAAGLVLLRAPARPPRVAVLWLLAMSGLTAWTALSALWAAAPSTALVEADRALLYLGVGALVVMVGPRAHRWLPHAISLAATVICADGVLLRVFPWFPGQAPFLGNGRLYQPVGYWNALGVVAALGGLIALQITGAERQPRAWRIGASASLAITLPVMYLTFSRGAAIAFAAGLVVSFLVARHRIDWTACALANVLAPALVIAVAASQQGLVSPYGDLAQAGDVLGVAVLLGVAVAVPVALAIEARPARLRSARVPRRLALAAIACSAALAGGGLVAVAGSPAQVWRHADAAFNREVWLKRDLQGNLSNRYAEVSLSGRTGLWQGAWRLGRAHPLIGAGAGSFGAYWAAQDRQPSSREALSLYLETFAELGAVGAVLLAGLVLLPLVAAVRRDRTNADLVLGAFAAFALHAAQDMDWEWPVVTVIGIACAAMVVRQAGAAVRDRPGGTGVLRAGLATSAFAIAAVSLAAAVAGAGLL